MRFRRKTPPLTVRPALPDGAQPLTADRPIERAVEDRLERDGLVSAIAKTIERAPRDGFVVGLAGPWGEGKSSVLNLVAERLDQRGSAQIVSFNPWMFSGSDELLERFFSQLATDVRVGNGAAGDRLAAALDRYGSALSRLGAVPHAGLPLRLAGVAARGASNLLTAGTSLHERRRELDLALAALGRPVVVIIDDLDRLRSHAEIAEMVRLIRLVGDLPRVTYLVAYERWEIARALGDGDQGRGDAYLEKIVQAVFELPPARRDLLDEILTDALNDAVGDVGNRRFSQERFQLLQFAGFRGLFRNLRDVRRYASALPSTAALVSDEVELSDVLALEALRLLEPEVFSLLVARVALLTGAERPFRRPGQPREDEPQREIEEIVAAARRPTIVRDLLKELFPAVGRHLGGTSFSSSFQSTWRRERRVAHRDVLLTYLERGLASTALSAQAVEQALTQLNEGTSLARLLDETSEPRLQQLLSRLEDYEGTFDLRRPTKTVQALIDAVGRLRPPEDAGFRYDGHVAVSRLLLRVLRSLDHEPLANLLKEIVFPDLSTRAEIVRMVGYGESTGNHLVSEAAAEALEREFIHAVLGAPAQQLGEEHDLPHLLWRVEQFDAAAIAARLTEHLGDRQFVLRWLGRTLLEKRGREPVALLPWSRLIGGVDEKTLVAAVQDLDEAWVGDHASDREREAVRQAKYYIKHPDRAQDDLRAFTGGDLDVA